MSNFYVVGTPIGNLKDTSLRALEVLGSVDIVLCEDTRVTKKLLSHFGIQAKTLSYHAHSKLSRTDEVINLLKQGKNVALVSDAGTPGISDPGSALVKKVREAMAEYIVSGELKIQAVPGASALTSAISISGVPAAEFVFFGFLPHKKGRETIFKEIASSKRTCIFYESPHRIMKTLASLEAVLCSLADAVAPDTANQKNVTVCRELTKIYEEVFSGTASEAKKYFEDNPDKMRGEFVVLVS